MEFRNNIQSAIFLERPNLTQKSVQSYVSTLSNLPKKMGDSPTTTRYFSDNVDKIIDYLQQVEGRKRKSILSPLVIITNDERYRELMKSDIKTYESNQDKQIKTEKEQQNWLDWSEILKIHAQMKNNADHIMKQSSLDNKQIDYLTKYIMLSMYILLPPRRLLGYAGMKMRNFTESDNYIDVKKGIIHYTNYKTSHKYGKQTFPLSINLRALIRKWMKINQSDYLLTKEYSPSELTKELNSIFKPRKISVNMLRHSFLTDYYGKFNGMPDLSIMQDLALKMGHSLETALQYIKKKE